MSKSCFRVKLKFLRGIEWFKSFKALEYWSLGTLDLGLVAWDLGIQKVIMKVLLKFL